MADPIIYVEQRIAAAFAKVGGAAAVGIDTAVRQSDRADAQVNGSLALAKAMGLTPREVALKVLEVVDLKDICSDAQVAGPGFINLTFKNEFLARELMVSSTGKKLGVRSATKPRKVVIDYSAPNVAKEMHVGHLRSTVIGDALVRMLTYVGNEVARENHVGDWGTPFGMLIEHLVDLGETHAAEELSVGDLDSFYRSARKKFDESEAFQTRARTRVVALQSGDAETLRLWKLLVAESNRYFQKIYHTLGVLLEPTDVMGESAYNELLPQVTTRLGALGMMTKSDGADVVFPEGFTNRENQPLPLIIRKTDGGYNYATSDLACVIDRVERIDAELLLYVVGAPQAQHLQMIAAVATQAGWLKAPREMVHVSFGNVLGADKKMLKTRSGDTVKLDALLTEAVERAAKAVAEKNPDLTAEAQAEIARIVGIGAVKYADLSTDRIKDYTFDWDRMLSFDGNTSPYLQYAHARICSIFRRANVERASVRNFEPTISHVAERELAMKVLQFDSALWDTLDKYSPHRLCTYLYDLATSFSSFYEQCPVLKAENENEKNSRLMLCDLTARVMQAGLEVLGIESPEQM
ncbi:MAG: arginine--tRNA ligase [Ilumatobacteraceae bacterium]|nr:arginine--tRNA ligase [Ilumatobacteraceae bacterium]